MPLRRIGVAIAAIVALFALGRISSVVVDWAWFSSIGYVGVFWTALAAKAALFVVVFAISTLLLWANATLALRFASGPRPRLPAAFNPSFVTFQASPGPWAGSYGLQPSPRVWRLLILAVAIILGILIALGETGKWDPSPGSSTRRRTAGAIRCSTRTSASTSSRCRSTSRSRTCCCGSSCWPR